MQVLTTGATGLVLYFEFIIGAIAVGSAIYIARNAGALRNYKESVASMECRIDVLEGDNKRLVERINFLEGQERGYSLAIRLLIEEIGAASICERASTCPDRQPPQRILDEFAHRTGPNGF